MPFTAWGSCDVPGECNCLPGYDGPLCRQGKYQVLFTENVLMAFLRNVTITVVCPALPTAVGGEWQYWYGS